MRNAKRAWRWLPVWMVALSVPIFLPACQSGPMRLTDAERASEATLAPGDVAPGIVISEWVKGEAVDVPDHGRIVMVDFWATWCGPCRASMGRVSRLQERFKDDLVVVAVTTVDPGNSASAIRRHVAAEGDRMGFRVAIDQGSKTADAYRRAARETGIPVSFLIDREGKIAWIGHPAEAGPVIEELVAGTWSVQAEAEKRKRFSRDRALAGPLVEDQKKAMDAGDSGAELRAVEALCRLDPEANGWSPSYSPYSRRVELLAEAGRSEEAITCAGESLALFPSDAGAYAAVGAAIWKADAERAGRCIDSALALMEKSERAAEGGDDWDQYVVRLNRIESTGVLRTAARVRNWQERRDEAVRLQEEAIARAEGEGAWPSYVAYLKKELAMYQTGSSR